MAARMPDRLRQGHTRHRRGVSLIETISAIVVLSVAVPAMLFAIRSAHFTRADAELVLRARWLAESKFEEVIADRHNPDRGYDWLTSDNYPQESDMHDAPGFSRRVFFTETGPDLTTPGDGYMFVRVDVTWTDSSGVDRSFEVETILTEYGAN